MTIFLSLPQSDDVLCCEFPESPKSMIGIEVTHCGQYAVVTTHEECRDNLVYITDLTEILQVSSWIRNSYGFPVLLGKECLFFQTCYGLRVK